MRNLILSITFVFASIFQVAANNDLTTSTLDVVKNEKSVVLNLLGFAAEAENFTIVNSANEIIFTDELNKYDNRVKYNLESLPSGNYTLKIAGDMYIEFLDAKITSEELTIESAETHLKPSLEVNDNRVVVNAYFPYEEGILVSIYNKSGKLLYSFNDSKTGAYEKAFNIEQLQAGNYEMVVSTDYFTTSNTISK